MSAALLAAVAFGVAILVAAVSFLVATWLGARARPSTPFVPGLGALFVLVFFLLTLPTAPPFSAGQRLGLGLLIGGAFGLIALLGSARLVGEEERFWPYHSVFALSLAVAAVSLVLLLFRGDPAAGLIGGALGFGAIAGLTLVFSEVAAGTAAAMEAAGLLAVTLAAGSALARVHFAGTEAQGWWPYVLALAALGLLGYALAYAFSLRVGGRSTAAVAGGGLLSAALVVGIGDLLATRLEPPAPVLGLLGLGLVTGALVAWLAVAGGAEAGPESRARAAVLGALLVLFAVVVGFKMLRGFGAAVALAAAWAPAMLPLALPRPTAWSPARVLALGANYLLLRVALEGLPGFPRTPDMSLQYALIGVVLGALLPVLLSSLTDRPGTARAVLLGALTLLSPVIVLALWGTTAAVGLLAGLVAAPAIVSLLAPFTSATWLTPAILVAAGLGLITVQLGQSASVLYELPRAYKASLAGAVALLAMLWVLGAGLARARHTPAPAAEQ